MKNPSLPCACCYRIVDLDLIEPTGICMEKLVQFECHCGNTRMIHKNIAHPDVIEKAHQAMREKGRSLCPVMSGKVIRVR